MKRSHIQRLSVCACMCMQTTGKVVFFFFFIVFDLA